MTYLTTLDLKIQRGRDDIIQVWSTLFSLWSLEEYEEQRYIEHIITNIISKQKLMRDRSVNSK